MTKHLVVGMGQIGSAIHAVLSENAENDLDGLDTKWDATPKHEKYDFLHICFPCANRQEFVDAVRRYMADFLDRGGVAIIHSTVPLGTTRLCGRSVVHSPCRGVHPNLIEGIKKFTKFFGCANLNAAQLAAFEFETLGIVVYMTNQPENTEALKLWDTTIYGLNILAEKWCHDYCETHGLDFSTVYTAARQTYNEGFERVGMPQFKQYCLAHMEGPIGGHCIVPNARLLNHEAGDLILSWQAAAEEKQP